MLARFQGTLVIDDAVAQVVDVFVGERVVVVALAGHDAVKLFDVGLSGIDPVFAAISGVGFQFGVEFLSDGEAGLLQLFVAVAHGREICRAFFVLKIGLSRFVSAFLVEVVKHSSQLGEAYFLCYRFGPQVPQLLLGKFYEGLIWGHAQHVQVLCECLPT